MGHGAPDYTRVTEIKGVDPSGNLITMAVDATGQLYAVIKGTDGVTLRTIAVDASGRIIMVPYGVTAISGTATVTQVDKDREIQGKEGTTLRTIAVDSAGRIIMVPYGVTSISGTATVTQAEKDREVQGKDGSTLRTLAVDANGQLIMVPRGQSGNYMSVDASGFMTSVMKGVDGVTLRTVAVDSSGNIIGVLQGDYAGSLKTLAVDSQGRMLAVLTDPEDVFGNPHYMGAAELAVRLGSIVTYERRGQVIFMDGFEDGDAPWYPHAIVGSGEYWLSTSEARSGMFSYRIRATGGADTRQDIDLYRSIPYLSNLGIEFSVSADTESNIIQLYWEIRGISKGIYAGLRIDVENNLAYYLNSAGGWTQLTSDWLVYCDPGLFTTFKLVVDPKAQKYVRLLTADRTYDMSTIAAQAIGASNVSYSLLHLGQLGKATAITAIWLDDIILTQNEPA